MCLMIKGHVSWNSKLNVTFPRDDDVILFGFDQINRMMKRPRNLNSPKKFSLSFLASINSVQVGKKFLVIWIRNLDLKLDLIAVEFIWSTLLEEWMNASNLI